MDGQDFGFSNPLQSRRFTFNVILMALAALMIPVVARAQAMGKAQVDAVAIAHVDPPTIPLSTGPAPVVTHELVALAGDAKIPTLLEKPSTDDKSVTTAKSPVANSDAAQVIKTPVNKVEAPIVAAQAAAVDGVVAKPPLLTAATPEVTPRTTAIESSLIKPVVKDTVPALAPSETSAVAPPGQTSLYARFSSIAQVVGALLVVVGLIFVGRVLVRKFVPGAAVGAGKGVMEIVARYPLAKNQSLVLVRIGSQLVVLNQTRDSSQSVLVIHDQVEVANILGQIQGAKPGSIQKGFSNLLANARMDLESTPPDGNDANIELGDLDSQLDEMAAAKRQLMELRQQVRSVRESLPIG